MPPPHLLAAAAVVHNGPSVVRLLRTGLHRLLPRVRDKMASSDIGQIMRGSAILGAGCLSGLYFIFSFCVMGALDAQPPASAIATMNSINAVIVNPPFMLIFMGTPLIPTQD